MEWHPPTTTRMKHTAPLLLLALMASAAGDPGTTRGIIDIVKDPEADGNSGIYIQNRYEIQIHNSFGVSEADYTASYCGSIYRRKKPDRLVCKKAGEWQSFDIVFRAARFDDGGKKTENARITVYQNGALIHDDYSIPGKTGVGEKEGPEPRPIKLQGHHNPVRFRNVWIQKLSLDAAEAKPAAKGNANVSASETTDGKQGKPLPRVQAAATKDPLAWIFHTPVEQKGDRRVGKLVNTQLYADTRDRLSFDRL